MAQTNQDEFGGIEVDEPNKDEFGGVAIEEQPETRPQITLSPYEKYRLAGGEPVAGPFGPANPQEVPALLEAAQRPFIPLPETTAKGPLAAAYRSIIKPAVEGIESPAGVLLAPALAESVPLRIAAGAGFGGMAAKSGLENMQSADPQAQLEGRMELASAPLLAFSGAAELKVPKVVRDVPRGAIPPESIVPAIREIGGEVVPGEAGQTHPEIIKENKIPAEDIDQRGFSDPQGKVFLDREAAAKGTQLRTEQEPGRLHSTDLPEAKPPTSTVGEATPAAPTESAAKVAGAGTPATEPAKAEPTPVRTTTQEPTVTPPVTEPVGMGGAVPSEFETPIGTPTSIKNAQVDIERVKRGLPPAIQPAKKSFGEVWDRAMAKIDQDPSYPDRLVDELEKRPRALTDEEDATLLQRQIDLQNEYTKATTDLARAFEDGRTEAVDSESLRVSGLLDNLQKIYDIGKKSGTETGRGLNARKMMANEDFSLAKMTLDLRAAKGGARLTPEQTLEVQRLNQKIAETQSAYDDYVSRSNVRIADLERQLSEQPRFSGPIIKAAERIVSTLDSRADAARARLREKMSRMSAGVDPTVITDLAEIGAAHIAHIGLDFAKWSTEMVREFGEWVRPHLNEVYEQSQKSIDSIGGIAQEVKKAVKGGFSALNDVEKETRTVDAIKEKVADKEMDKVSWYVQRLARDFVARGIKQREQLIDAVHSVLQRAIPDITRRQTMDAISGYGDFRQLRKDEISTTLRGMKGEMQQLAKLEDMAKGQPPLKTGLERRTPTDAERQLIKEVNDAKYKFQIPVQDPETQLKSALDTLKTTLTNRIKDYEDRIARGDYEKRAKRELVLDSEASRLKAQNERVKKEFRKGVELERFKNARSLERGAHWVNKWRRGFILSGWTTLGKLTGAALARTVITPAEELVGSAIGKAIPSIAEKAPRESGFNLSAESRAIRQGVTQGMRDAWDTLRTGESDLDALYGKTNTLPGSWLDFFGRVHGFMKAPVKRAEFERSFAKRIEFQARKGIDVTDPWVQMRTGIEAYKDANRSIFLQDNRVVSGYKRFISALEEPSKITGRVPTGGKVAATAARILVPIVKVPTNIVAETAQYAVGSVTGLARLGMAFRRGIENLKPEESDLIMRELKKGSLGGVALLVGYFNPDVFGGYYQPREKRRKDEAPAGGVRVYGHNIPSYWIHNPLIETLQIGATVRRVSDAHINKKSNEKKGIGEGIYAGALGMTEQQPFINEMRYLTKSLDPNEKNQFWGELAKSLVVPQAIQQFAAHRDVDAQGRPIKRDPKTIVQHIETGIPGLREKVPKRKGQ